MGFAMDAEIFTEGETRVRRRWHLETGIGTRRYWYKGNTSIDLLRRINARRRLQVGKMKSLDAHDILPSPH